MMDKVAISIDFEFFTHTPAYRTAVGKTNQATVGIGGIHFLLDAFDEFDTEATFFVVSDIAETHPRIITTIVDRGHEIASHTRNHVLLPNVSKEERRQEIIGSRSRLQQVSGQRVNGIRAPAFDLPSNYFELLLEAGYSYDSSVIPCRKIPGWYGGDYSRQNPDEAISFFRNAPPEIIEIPVSVMPWLRLPLSGAWTRFFGAKYSIFGMRLLAGRGTTPVLYFHPWEFVDLPEVTGVPRRVYWRTGKWMCRALRRILKQPYQFVSVKRLI